MFLKFDIEIFLNVLGYVTGINGYDLIITFMSRFHPGKYRSDAVLRTT